MAGALVSIAIAVTMWVMLAQTDSLQGAERATARIDAIKTALTVGAGTGGAAALLLALRRQWLSEHTHIRQESADHAAEFDASERRITELYTAATGQLGSDSAPVRLAGLYALERLAQDHPAHRQTIVEVYCSYLRMPFSPTPPPDLPESELAGLSAAERAAASGAYQAANAAWEQERVVRVTTQRILTQHLFTGVGHGPDPAWPLDPSPEEPKFWPGVDLDLTGAVLLDFEFVGRRVESATFERCRFVGGANFAYSEFIKHATFRDARFEAGSGHFMSAWFGLRTMFLGTDFGNEKAVFDGATFTGMTLFEGAVMGGGASFEAARALTDFNRNWGTIRELPEGWVERPLAADEVMPLLDHRFSRWPATNLPPGSEAWTLIVPESEGIAGSSSH
ncbi:pentapeptide repeat-containing protein [Kitasatospora sp. NPDC008115]|uniref:pentapeptide repeat-containing protein n=1 Tax=Kitasatospora sp. NPDC008115 TaxID=3364022 RepID=UPI0036E5543E